MVGTFYNKSNHRSTR
nr:unnamed protein product [Callosobruchus chinensis]